MNENILIFRGTGYAFKLWACSRGIAAYGEYMFMFGCPVVDVRTMLN